MFLCRDRSAGGALAPSGWPDGLGIPGWQWGECICGKSVSQHIRDRRCVHDSTMNWRAPPCAQPTHILHLRNGQKSEMCFKRSPCQQSGHMVSAVSFLDPHSKTFKSLENKCLNNQTALLKNNFKKLEKWSTGNKFKLKYQDYEGFQILRHSTVHSVFRYGCNVPMEFR